MSYIAPLFELFNDAVELIKEHWAAIETILKTVSVLLSLWYAASKFISKSVKKYSFLLAVLLNFLLIGSFLFLLLRDDAPITRIDVAVIAFYVCALVMVVLMVVAKKARDNTVYQAKIKYGLFHDGDMDIPDNLPTQKKCHSPTREG